MSGSALFLLGLLVASTKGQESPPGGAPAHPPSPKALAERLLAAVRNGEADEIGAATAEVSDPIQVAEELLAGHLAAALEARPAAPGHLEAAEALAAHMKDDRRAEGLPAILERWRLLDDAGLRREARLRDILKRVEQAPPKDRAAILKEHEGDLPREVHCITTWRLRFQGAVALRAATRLEEAARGFREAARAAERLGWPTARAEALLQAGHSDRSRRDFLRALQAYEEALSISEAIGDRYHVATALESLGVVSFRLDRHSRAMEFFERAVAEQGTLGMREERARTLANLGGACMGAGRIARAIEVYDLGLKENAALGNRFRVAQCLTGLGLAHVTIGDGDRALEAQEEALRVYRALGERSWAARVLADMADAHRIRGHHEESLETARRALAELEALGDRSGVAATLTSIGSTYGSLGQYSRAIETLEDALRRHEALGDRKGIAMTLEEIGWARHELGEYDQAITIARRVLEEREAREDRVALSAALTLLGDLCEHLGLYAEALRHLERSLELEKTIGRPGEVTAKMRRLGDLRLRLGDHSRALETARTMLRDARAAGDRKRSMIALRSLAEVHTRMGRLADALGFFEDALEEAEALGDEGPIAAALWSIGDTSFLMGEMDKAADHLRRALDLFQTQGIRSPPIRGRLGDIHSRRGEHAEALRSYTLALRDAQEQGDRIAAARVLEGLSAHHLKTGRAPEALECARRALETRVEASRGLGEEEAAALRAWTRPPSDLGLRAILALEASGRGATGGLAEAFRFVETGRALLLVDALANRGSLLSANLPRDLLEADASARRRVESRWREIVDLASRSGADPAALVGAREALDAAKRDLREAVGRVHREARRVGAVVYPEPVGLVDFQKVLPEDAAFISYQLTNAEALALVVTGGTVSLKELGRSEQIQRAARRYLDLVSWDGRDEEPEARALYDLLLRPLEGLVASKTRLLVSPDDALAFLPFAALLRSEGDERARVLERWQVVLVPSGTVYAELRKEAREHPRGDGFLALGDPVYPGEKGPAAPGAVAEARWRGLAELARLDRLPATGAEVRALAALFPEERRTLLLREQATRGALAEALDRVRGRLLALHLAGHGFVDPERPLLTGLILGNGETLTLNEVYRLRVPADLAVLSACETGKGNLQHGEGVMGFVRGFFFAGSPRVVVSSWKVADESTQDLMVAFYGRMVRDGMAPAAALRESMRERLAAGGSGSHPFHWAGFTLWGLDD